MMNDFADIDFEREERCGFSEVVYGAGKTSEQISDILAALVEAHGVALATRVSAEAATMVLRSFPDAHWFERCGVLFIDRRRDPIDGTDIAEVLDCPKRAEGQILVACAGTSDLPVAEEAALTARVMGSRVRLITDVGVAGIHRTFKHLDEIRESRVIIVVAGMEGALASVVAGLVDVAVIGVPTSVGYGASFGGLAALLAMLNSCAGGVSVVNIDNGFGAGQIADRINRPSERFRTPLTEQ